MGSHPPGWKRPTSCLEGLRAGITLLAAFGSAVSAARWLSTMLGPQFVPTEDQVKGPRSHTVHAVFSEFLRDGHSA